MSEIIAHFRKLDESEQLLTEHLENVAKISSKLASKIDLQDAGEILGLLHDLGKNSKKFQQYIRSATGFLNPDIDDEYVDFVNLKGKIDHSTAGAQWIWQRFRYFGPQGRIIGKILAVCLASHHGGMLDCLELNGTNGFIKRIGKSDLKTNLSECLTKADATLLVRLERLSTKAFLKDFIKKIIAVAQPANKEEPELIESFRLGLLTRFLFSCLIDADRTDSADFEFPENIEKRSLQPVDWQPAIERIEEKVNSFSFRTPIDSIRREISENCRRKAEDSQGIYTLTVPTGGGKTLSSIRWALHHANKHKLDHIIYIIPFTSIIEQNAEEVRKVLEKSGDSRPWVLEHHSNLEPETQTWQSKLSCENWDTPIIFTTMVQFLEVLFGGGTRGARRMHTLAYSVLIFDEIQSLPVNCVHLFCNALQFFVDHAKTTALLCTATQPLLNDLKNADKGQLNIPPENELVPDVKTLFDKLRRVTIQNRCRPKGWSADEIAGLALAELGEKESCLVVVNTKNWARQLYELCRDELKTDENIIFHLSTNLCPAHRKEIFSEINQRLDDKKPVLCISTQLIEAGVDVDFHSVIRFLAGLDSIAQAAGRCNRNGKRATADVHIVNPAEEHIDMLEDIRIGRDIALRIFSEPEHEDYLDPEVIRRYFSYYFYRRSGIMDYPLTVDQVGRNGDSLLNLLGDNPHNIGRVNNPIALQQSFKTAGRLFQAIKAPTRSVIVQYGRGREIVSQLCADFEPSKAHDLLKQAQQYLVNVFPNVWEKLCEAKAVIPVQAEEDIFYLDEQYYSEEFGLSTELITNMEFMSI